MQGGAACQVALQGDHRRQEEHPAHVRCHAAHEGLAVALVQGVHEVARCEREPREAEGRGQLQSEEQDEFRRMRRDIRHEQRP